MVCLGLQGVLALEQPRGIGRLRALASHWIHPPLFPRQTFSQRKWPPATLFTEVTLLWSSGVGSGTDLGLVHRHCGRETATVSGQHAVDLPGYVALQTADDLSFALALLCAP